MRPATHPCNKLHEATLVLALTLLGLSYAQAASANTIYTPYGNASVNVYLVTAFDPIAFIIRPAALTVRKSDGACSIGVFDSDDNGIPTSQPVYQSGSGHDRIAFWNDPNWSSFTCGPWTMGVKTLNPGNTIPQVNAGAGNDVVFDSSAYPTWAYLQDGNDTIVSENTAIARAQAFGGTGDDVFHVFTDYVNVIGESGSDFFCLNNHSPSGLGGSGWDVQTGSLRLLPEVEQNTNGPCPALPQ
jgi:hypothetical protein